MIVVFLEGSDVEDHSSISINSILPFVDYLYRFSSSSIHRLRSHIPNIMSTQIVTGGKAKTITSFFSQKLTVKPIVKEVIHVPHSSVTSRLCEICGKAISNQGWKNHIANTRGILAHTKYHV